MQEIQVRSLGQEDPLEKGMAFHSSILACEISQTEEHGEATVHEVTKESDMTQRLNNNIQPQGYDPSYKDGGLLDQGPVAW